MDTINCAFRKSTYIVLIVLPTGDKFEDYLLAIKASLLWLENNQDSIKGQITKGLIRNASLAAFQMVVFFSFNI